MTGYRHTLLAAALLVATLAMAGYPAAVSAQAPQNEHMFDQRMQSRIDSVQVQIRRLREELDGGAAQDDGRRSGGYGTSAGLYGSLDALDSQCRELEGELQRMRMSGGGTPYDIYARQQRIEYYVYALERQVQDIRRSIRPARDDKKEPADDDAAPPAEPEDGKSDEDWAEEWAKGVD